MSIGLYVKVYSVVIIIIIISSSSITIIFKNSLLAATYSMSKL